MGGAETMLLASRVDYVDGVTTRKRTAALGHVWLVARLTAKMVYLGCTGSPYWVVALVRLVLFSLALGLALVRSASYYATTVRKNVAYGPGMRHLADIYDPVRGADEQNPLENSKGKAPVVVFVTGGAWIIGYKAWAVPLGRALAAQGVLVIAPDYRNCPQARIDGMLCDVDRAIGWALAHCGDYGGDPSRLVVVGQSAGAHLCALLLLRKAEALEKKNQTGAAAWDASWKPRDIAAFVGVSGPYHVEATATHWTARGFSHRAFTWIFGEGDGASCMSRHSPTDECARLLAEGCAVALPRVRLVHGSADMSAPCVASELLEARLRLLGVRCEPTRIYRRWSHTDPILERPFAGDHKLHRDIFDIVAQRQPPNHTGAVAFDDSKPGCGRLTPQWSILFARWCVPF